MFTWLFNAFPLILSIRALRTAICITMFHLNTRHVCICKLVAIFSTCIIIIYLWNSHKIWRFTIANAHKFCYRCSKCIRTTTVHTFISTQKWVRGVIKGSSTLVSNTYITITLSTKWHIKNNCLRTCFCT